MAWEGTTSSAIPIGDFVQLVKQTITQDPYFQLQTLKGEVSQWKVHNNNVYFSLRDEKGQMNCVIWNSSIPIDPSIQEGSEVTIIANLDLWPKQGRIQLVVKKIIPIQSLGQMEKTKQDLIIQLRNEGVFDREKKTIPFLPKHIAIVTGKQSAALADMKRLATERFPTIFITFIEVLVQGQRAGEEITRGLAASRQLSKQQVATNQGIPPVDVIIVGRGGGSVEDLWAFNLESVARAIVACEVPVVSAVGHESDFLVSDMVADVRASTPSHAIELVVPDRLHLDQTLDDFEYRSQHAIARYLEEQNRSINYLNQRLLQAPKEGVLSNYRKLDHCEASLKQSMSNIIHSFNQQLVRCETSLQAAHPHRTLERGYAMVEREGSVIQSVQQLKVKDEIVLRLSDGIAQTSVLHINGGKNHE